MIYHPLGKYYELSADDWAEISCHLITVKQYVFTVQSSEDKPASAKSPANPYLSGRKVQFQKWDAEDEYDGNLTTQSLLSSERKIGKNLTFAQKVDQLMDEKGMKRPEVYRRAGLERALFSKLFANSNYSPSRDTAISVAFGLKLSLEEAEDLLTRAGFALSHSVARDLVIECCFKEGICEVVKVNIILEKLGYLPLNKISYR